MDQTDNDPSSRISAARLSGMMVLVVSLSGAYLFTATAAPSGVQL
jgi:hypothetical protein